MSIKTKYEHLEYKDLPRLPIPPLDVTGKNYLEYVEALLSPEDFKKTQKYVEDFLKGEGKNLQKDLEYLDKRSPTSFLEGLWDTSYLGYRVPNVVNVSPIFAYQNDAKERTQTQRAASVVVSACNFYKTIQDGTVKQDKERVTPLCMTQYGKILGTTRIPKLPKDELKEYKDTKHVIVIAGGNFYRVDYVDSKGNYLNEAQLTSAFDAIKKDAETNKPEIKVGILTSQHRDTWAKFYPRWKKLNEKSMEDIESALIAVVLSDEDVSDDNKFLRSLLIGNDTGNRWYDKSLQFIVFKDGRVGINMEHSGFDGHTLLMTLHNMYNDELKREKPTEAIDFGYKATALPWKFEDDMKEFFEKCKKCTSDLNKSLSLVGVDFRKYGSTFMKKGIKMSPDAFVQMMFQLTYYKMFKKPGSTYESANVKRFYHGRTECVRTVSKESLKFSKLYCDEKASDIEKITAMREAGNAHVGRVKTAKVGMTGLRSLFAMKALAQENFNKLPNYEIPEIFKDPAYGLLGTDLLSTSNCSGTVACHWFGFGPTAGEGFGLGYIVNPDSVRVCVTDFRGKASEYASTFIQTLEEIQKKISAIEK